MDKAEIEKLITIVESDTDKASLTVLYNAWVRSFAALKVDAGRSNLADWRASEKALKEKFDELSTKYQAQSGEERLDDRYAAVVFLQSLGYKIKKSKFYKDAASGKIRVNQDGTIDEAMVRAYAERYLKRVKSGPESGEIDNIHIEKAIAETK